MSEGAGAQPWLWNNLAAALLLTGGSQLTPEALKESSPLAKRLPQIAASSAGLAELLVGVLDRAAHAAVAEGDWEQARDLWEQARQVVGGSTLGSPRQLWHNLALANEALERWLDAAEAWRALLRTRPLPQRSGRPERWGSG